MDSRRCVLPTVALVCAALAGCDVDLVSLHERPPQARETITPARTAGLTTPPPPVATATPDPVEMLSQAEHRLENGEYDEAIALYDRLQNGPAGDPLTLSARRGLGTALLRAGEVESAVSVLTDLVTHTVSLGERDQRAHFLLAEALVEAGDPRAAASEYRAYLSAGTVITGYVSLWTGEALHLAGEYQDAVASLEDAVEFATDRSIEAEARERLALALVATGDFVAAVSQYDAILAMSQIPAYRARISYQAAETMVLAGDVSTGYDRYKETVESYPSQYYAYLALVRLVEAGRPVDDFLRGVVDYYGRAYGPAVEALYRHLERYPETHSPDVHWYLGLSFREAGSTALAAAEFRRLIEDHEGSVHWGDAWMALASLMEDDGDFDGAVEAYEEFVALAPTHSLAAEALWEIAQVAEQSAGEDAAEPELLRTAGDAYYRCWTLFPDAGSAESALFRAALQYYRAGDFWLAAERWQVLVDTYPDSPRVPQSHLWIGKALVASGAQAEAEAALRAAESTDPTGYYGIRAGDLLTHGEVSALWSGAETERADDELPSRAEAEAWLAGWNDLDDAANLDAVSADLVGDRRLQRGLELWSLGRQFEAKQELEDLRHAMSTDPSSLYQLALLYRDIGLHSSSVLCAARIIQLSPVESAMEAPEFLARLAYPTYYRDLILDSALEFGLSPLLLFSVIRQESLFESLAFSSASAHGLMQVIPSTGAQIASELDWPAHYDTRDLYRPNVSVRFGGYYLAAQLDHFDGRVDVSLAAYNGGPSNAARWLEAGGRDPDMFLELITLSESRQYVQRIAEHFAVYRALYGAAVS
jgi:soluble lytic murein transglycosylase